MPSPTSQCQLGRASTSSAPHSFAEDAHALLIGSALAAFGLVMLHAAGLATGGVAGMALLLSRVTGLPIGILFAVINLPVLLLAVSRMGLAFTLRSVATMAVTVLATGWMPLWIQLQNVNPAFAAVFGGSLIGLGVLSLARHGASGGGIGLIALYLQQRRGVSAGVVQLCADVLVLAAAFLLLDRGSFGFSALSAFAQSLVMIAYHRPGRYTGAPRTS